MTIIFFLFSCTEHLRGERRTGRLRPGVSSPPTKEHLQKDVLMFLSRFIHPGKHSDGGEYILKFVHSLTCVGVLKL